MVESSWRIHAVTRAAVCGITVFVLCGYGPCEDLCEDVDALRGGPDHPDQEDASFLAIGDSILGIHQSHCQAIPHHAGLDVGLYVQNDAVIGRRMSYSDGTPTDIPAQYDAGLPWDWVAITGGANDLYQECLCYETDVDHEQECQQLLDQLADPGAGSGEMLDLITAIRDDAANDATILLVGYYPFVENTGWEGCRDELQELSTRYQQIAAADPDVLFIDPTSVMDATLYPDHFMPDGVHPSPYGADAVGELLGAEIGGP
jgi:lysophospholipase L1-like esterase